MDERDIYRRQGFAQSVGFGAAPAVVVGDFVARFTDPAHFGGDRTLAPHEANLFDIQQKYAAVMDLAAIESSSRA